MVDNKLFFKLENSLGKGRVLQDEILANHCTWRIGGPAKFWFEAKTSAELILAIKSANEFRLPFFILGGGTNVLFSDKGFNGIIIKNSSANIKLLGVSGKKGNDGVWQKVFVEADSGVSFNRLVRFTLDEGLSNLEYFLGQPGSVGGALYINAHFPKQNKFVGDYLRSAKLINLKGDLRSVSSDYFQYGYDASKIQSTKEIVLSATFELIRSTKEKVWKIGNETIKYRQETQPQGFSTAGCTFRNITRAESLIVSSPNLTQSAGFLIDQCGLKGYSINGAQISENHANFILNKGNAKAKDVIALMKLCKESVRAKFGVDLKEEIILVGDFDG
jgi:UDP-N-acetylmuramate dehydrogenase